MDERVQPGALPLQLGEVDVRVGGGWARDGVAYGRAGAVAFVGEIESNELESEKGDGN